MPRRFCANMTSGMFVDCDIGENCCSIEMSERSFENRRSLTPCVPNEAVGSFAEILKDAAEEKPIGLAC